MNLDIEEIYNINFDRFYKQDQYFKKLDDPYYKFLAYLSTTLLSGSIILDLGTHKGLSCAALSYNPKCEVITIDPKDRCIINQKKNKNVTVVIDKWENKTDLLSIASLIVVDLNHTGYEEDLILLSSYLAGFSGYIVFDDIYFNYNMKEFWSSIQGNQYIKKYNLDFLDRYWGCGMIEVIR